GVNRMYYLYDIVSMMLARLRREDGQTMAEYGILIAVIALIVVVAAVILGSSISNLFSSTSGKL
ncbi:MAG: Flp family type IVb pilin, partial [Solirubrobacteraceae bacterium]